MFSATYFPASTSTLLQAVALAFTLTSLPHAAHAQDWAKAALDKSPRHREYVAIKAGDRTVTTFVVYPEVKKKAPVVVMIHEIFGLSDWAKLMADELAAEGYIVVEPDLLSGMQDGTHTGPGSATAAGTGSGGTDAYTSMDAITKAVSGLPNEQVMSNLDAVADYGLQLPSANGKLAVAGFCWGGGKTFAFATHRKGISAALVFYGPPPPPEQMTAITAPIYGFYAEQDARIDATLPATIAAMKAAGKRYEPVTYAGAGHGFMRAGQAPDATPENAKAWHDGATRMLSVLKGTQ